MTGSMKALCSILGTLLALALLASPVLAQSKKKKAAAEPAAAAPADEPGSLDSLMETAAESKKDKKAAAPAQEEPAEEAVPEPDAWERPPVEEKAPPKVEAKPTEDPPVHGGLPFSAGLLLGYGFKTDRQTGGLGADPYGFMAGLRGGYTLDFGLYLGLYFKYFLGSSSRGGSGRIAMEVRETSVSYMQFGAEVGYDVYAGPIILRPSLELGAAIAFSDATGVTRSTGDVVFGPGVSVLYPINELFLGGDLRGSLVAGDGVGGLVLAATGGMRF